MDIIEHYLETHGPCLSGEVIQYLMQYHLLSHAAARKRLSRNKDAQVKRLRLLTFQRNAQFLYLSKQFNTPIYWGRLGRALEQNNTAYGAAISALLVRNGFVSERHFPIICGSPESQKGHVSAESVLKRLIDVNFLQLSVSPLGERLVSIKRNDQAHEAAFEFYRKRMIIERVLIDAVATWLKRMTLVSYSSIRTRDDEFVPKVGTLAWDITAPTYLSPFVKKKRDNGFDPGFFVCDVHFGEPIDLAAASAFFRKCSALRALRNINRTLEMFVAESFTLDAFAFLKSKGVAAITVSNMFGDSASANLRALGEGINDIIKNSVVDEEKLNSTITALNALKNESGTIRGYFFELMISEVLRLNSAGNCFIEMNRKVTAQEKKAEIDVLVYQQNHSVRFVEAKAYSPYYDLPHHEVERWLKHNIQVVRSYVCGHPEWKDLSLSFELWTTAPLGQQSRELIERMSPKKETARYRIAVKEKNELIQEFTKANNKSMLDVLENYFVARPA